MHCNSRCFMMNRIPEYKYNHLGTSESSDENNLLKKEADDFYMEYLSVWKIHIHYSFILKIRIQVRQFFKCKKLLKTPNFSAFTIL